MKKIKDLVRNIITKLKSMTFWFNNTYSANCEGVGLSFRFGYTCFGLLPPLSFWRRPVKELPIWYRLFCGWKFGFIYHSGQCNRWYIFNIHIGAFQIWWLTEGEKTDSHVGFHIAFNGLKNWKVLI